MVRFFRFLLVALVFSSGMASLGLAANCEKEIEERVKELWSQDGFDRRFSVDLFDVNSDGINEILYSERCSGNGCYPEIDIDWFSSTCDRKGLWLEKWEYVHDGWEDIIFSSVADTIYMTGKNQAWNSELWKTVFISNVSYAFDGKEVSNVRYLPIFRKNVETDYIPTK